MSGTDDPSSLTIILPFSLLASVYCLVLFTGEYLPGGWQRFVSLFLWNVFLFISLFTRSLSLSLSDELTSISDTGLSLMIIFDTWSLSGRWYPYELVESVITDVMFELLHTLV